MGRLITNFFERMLNVIAVVIMIVFYFVFQRWGGESSVEPALHELLPLRSAYQGRPR